MRVLILISLLACNWLVANGLSWALAEYRRPLLPFKPFNCRPCLSFWLTFIAGAPLVWYFGDGGETSDWLAVTLVLTAFLNYYINKSKIKIYE